MDNSWPTWITSGEATVPRLFSRSASGDLALSPPDRAITAALLDRKLTCLELEPRHCTRGALLRLRVHVCTGRDGAGSLRWFGKGRLKDIEQELRDGQWLPDRSDVSTVDWIIGETNSN